MTNSSFEHNIDAPSFNNMAALNNALPFATILIESEGGIYLNKCGF